ELLRAGTADGFEEVYDRHAAQVLAWARARVGEHAADLTAEVFARAWLGRSRFRHENETSALPWLLGIARNVLRESLRKRRGGGGSRTARGVGSGCLVWSLEMPLLRLSMTGGRSRSRSVEHSHHCRSGIANCCSCG